MTTSYAVKRLAVSDPAIVDVNVLGERKLQLVARKSGDTDLLIWERDHLQAVVDIHVGTIHMHIVDELRRILDNPSIQVDVAGDSIVLRGDVATLHEFEQAGSVAEAFIGYTREAAEKGLTLEGKTKPQPTQGAKKERAKVINLLRVGGSQQVMIEVVIAELSKTMRHAFGVNLFGAVTVNNRKQATFQQLLGNMTSNPEHAMIPGGDPQWTQIGDAVSLAGTFFEQDSLDVRLFVEAVQADQVGTILAEPKLIARSGEAADFLVGGEVPIPMVSSRGVSATEYTVLFKKFGISVEFTPTVMASDQIHMQITAEASERDDSGGVNVLGLQIPAFKTRRVNTAVELGDGESFAVAGLLREDVRADLEQVPFLGSLPILGQLFRSRAFQKGLTELVMIITPRLVKPLGPEPVELPTDQYLEPSSFEFYWMGRIEGGWPRKSPSDVDESDAADANHGANRDSEGAQRQYGMDESLEVGGDDQTRAADYGDRGDVVSRPLIGAFGERLYVPAPEGVN